MYYKYLSYEIGRNINECAFRLGQTKPFTVRNMNGQGYLTFKDYDEFYKFNTSLDIKDRTFEEVIFGDKPQRIYFDIDFSADDTSDGPSIIHTIQTAIIDKFTIYTSACLLAGIDISLLHIDYSDFIITSSIADEDFIKTIPENDDLKKDATKKSYHIYLNFAFANNREASYFANLIKQVLPADVSAHIDTLYKSVQNLRITNNHKPASARIKTILSNHKWEDTIVSNVKDLIILPLFHLEQMKPINADLATTNDDIIQFAIKAVDLKNFVVRGVNGNIIELNRLNPTFCEICQRVHDKDNTLSILIDDAIYFICRRNPSKKIKIANIPNDIKKPNTVPSGRLIENQNVQTIEDKRVQLKFSGSDFIEDKRVLYDLSKLKYIKQPKLNIKNKLEYTAAELRPFTDGLNDSVGAISNGADISLPRFSCGNAFLKGLHQTLVVHAPMKIGKTKAMIEYLKNFVNKTIIIISFRQTFSAFVKSALDKHDFQLYSDVTGPLIGGRYIVQVESLYRVLPRVPYDLIIMDESESIFSQFDSGLSIRLPLVLATFKWLMQTAHHVLAMDANISERTIELLKYFRSDDIFYHHCIHKNAVNDNWHVADISTWLQALVDSLNAGDNIFVPTNSITSAEAIYKMIKNKLPDINIVHYTSKTSITEKRMHFNDVHKYWIDKRVVIITPTCTAGVSFEHTHFNKVFAYFTNKSCDVETCRQMVARVRAVNEFYVTFDCLPLYGYPTSREQLLKHLASSENLLESEGGLDLLINYEYNEKCELKVIETPALKIWIENKIIANLSKNNFIERFLSQIYELGANIEYVKLNSALLDEYEACKDDSVNVAKLINADLIDDQLAHQITADLEENRPVEQAEMLLLHKYSLYKFYDLKNDFKLTEAFIKTYDNRQMRERHVNKKRLMPSIDETLEKIKHEEMGKHLHYTKHFIALNTLKEFGFKTFNDFMVPPPNFKIIADKIARLADSIQIEFGFRAVMNYTEIELSVLKNINKMISIYGYKIKRRHDMLSEFYAIREGTVSPPLQTHPLML